LSQLTVTHLTGFAGMLLACGGAAHAKENGSPTPDKGMTLSDFDLARDCPREALASDEEAQSGPDEGHLHTALLSEPVDTSDNGIPRPHWAQQIYEDGPSIEFGALGAGRKGTPRLVHLALNWDY